MKKFMFSAVALIAFSFAGMANTGGEEKLNNEVDNLIIKEHPCSIVRTLATGLALQEGYSLASALVQGNVAYNNCMASQVDCFEDAY